MVNIINSIDFNCDVCLEKIADINKITLKDLISEIKTLKSHSINKNNIFIFNYHTIINLIQTKTLSEISEEYNLSYNEIKIELKKHCLNSNDVKPSKKAVEFLSNELAFSDDEICIFYNIESEYFKRFKSNNKILNKNRNLSSLVSPEVFYKMYYINRLSLKQISMILNISFKTAASLKKKYSEVYPEMKLIKNKGVSDIMFQYINNRVKLQQL